MIFDYIGPLENAFKKDQNITFFWTFCIVLEKKISKFDKKGYFWHFLKFWGLKRVFQKTLFLNLFFSEPLIGPLN